MATLIRTKTKRISLIGTVLSLIMPYGIILLVGAFIVGLQLYLLGVYL